jgi:hypothetical protein
LVSAKLCRSTCQLGAWLQSLRKGETPILDAIDITTAVDLRSNVIGSMLYAFVRVGAAIGMRVEASALNGGALGSRCTSKATRPAKCLPLHLDEYVTAYLSINGLVNEPAKTCPTDSADS